MQISRLKEIRESHALSMRELARRSRVGTATIVRAEQGKPVYPTTIRRLAKALGVTPAELRSNGPRERPAPSPLDASLERQHALAEAAWARGEGNLAEAERWERIAAGLAAIHQSE
jgi:transcriptional regulator with XRE-family HTH domain